MAHSIRNQLMAASAAVVVFGGTSYAQEAQENDAEFLGTIVLGESKREVQTETATPVTVIDQTEIDDRQAQTIAELIDSVPGVTLLNGSTPSGSGINIRGFGANGTYGTDQKVAIQVDGASVGSEEIYRVGTQLYTDPYLYRSVEVIRGTVGSFEYGSGIIGGIVRLETKDASDFTHGEPGFAFGQTLGASSNGEGFNSSSTLAWQPSDQLELLGNFSWRKQELQSDGDGKDIDNTAFELPSYLLKGRYTFGADRAHAFAFSTTRSKSADRDVPYDSFGTTGGSFGNVDRDTVTQTASLSYTYTPADNELIDLEVLLSYANQEIDQTCLPASAPFGCFSVVNADHQYETTRLLARNASFFTTGQVDHELRSGIELIKKERKDAAAAPGGTDNRVALFLIDQMSFGNGWELSPALRYETSEIDGKLNSGKQVTYENESLMGGVSLRYAFDNGLSLFGSYAYTANLPILDDLEKTALMTRSEKSNTYELGFAYDRTGILHTNDTLSFKMNYYQTDLWDVTSYFRVISVRVNGFEIEGSYAAENGFYVDLNANIIDAENTTSKGVVQDWRNTPADSLRLTVGRNVNTSLDLSWEIVAVDRVERNGKSVDGYTTHNLRATFIPQEGILSGTEFRFGVENLADELYKPALATRSAPGRNFKFTVSRLF
jgi:hemoglobin/transferrin/lactoferrin receptor protein